MRERWRRLDPVGFGVLGAALLLFVPLCGAYGLWDPWETHYAEAARQIVVRGDWWTLFWENDYFFSKPILLFWMMAASFELFGVTELAARLPVALSAVVGVWAAYWGVSGVTRSRAIGALAAAAVASAPLYAFIGRQCITDMPFVASMTVALMAFARYEMSPGPRRARHIYLFYFACGLATLAKGPLGLLLPGAIVLAYLLTTGDWRFLLRARIPTGTLVFLAVAAPWYGAMIAMHGERFIDEFFLYNNVQRATGAGVHGARPDFLYYFTRSMPGDPTTGGPWVQVGLFPWVGLFPAALFTYGVRRAALFSTAGGRARGLEGERVLRLALLLICWAVVSLAVFSLIPTKFNHYLLPLAPAVAMVAALWIDDAARQRVGEPAAGVGFLFAAGLVAWIAGLLGQAPWNVLNLFIYEYSRHDLRQFDVGLVYQALGYAMAIALGLAGLLRRRRMPMAAVTAACALGLAAYGVDHYLVVASDCGSQADAFEHYEAERRPGDQLVNFQMNYRGEVFYGRSEAVKSVSTTHLRWLLSRSDRTFIVGNEKVYDGMRAALRQVAGREARVLNPTTCYTRMLLHDGPRVTPPDFEAPPGTRFDELPDHVTHRLDGVRLGPDVSLAGYDLRWIGAGNALTADISLYLRCERETDEWWKVFLHGESEALPGRRAVSDHTALGDEYPSVAWRRGEVILDRTRLPVGWILEAIGGEGELQVAAGLFSNMTRAKVSPESAHDGEHRIILGRFTADEAASDSVVDELPEGVARLEPPVALGDVATIVATEARLQHGGRHPYLEVVLYLRAERRTRERWQLFVHAVGEEGRRQVSDHEPVSTSLGTTSWEPGRLYADRSLLDLGHFLPGPVEVHVGLFSGDRRAEVSPPEANDGEHRYRVGDVELR